MEISYDRVEKRMGKPGFRSFDTSSPGPNNNYDDRVTGYNCGFGYADNYYAYRYSSKKSKGYYDLYTNREISALDISGDANDQYPTARSVHDMDFKHQWAIDIDYG